MGEAQCLEEDNQKQQEVENSLEEQGKHTEGKEAGKVEMVETADFADSFHFSDLQNH